MKNDAIVIFIVIIFIVLYLIYLYGYYFGSCKINKSDYKCDENFCLYKVFSINLDIIILNEINEMLKNKLIQTRVSINSYFENIYNCALPNRKGITIPTENIIKYSPNLIEFYKNELCNIISKNIGLQLYPTNLDMPTSCVILIYEEEGDWINWHYDYNYYDGRFFTVLIPITNEETCTYFQYKDDKNQIINIDVRNNNAICFEGNYLYHRASKLCKNQKRVILSCQYVTDNNMNFINKLRIKLKDYAFIGKIY